MVCDRCIKVVKDELSKLGYEITFATLGEVKINSKDSPNLNAIKDTLFQNGFLLIDDKSSKLIEKVKVLVIEKIQQQSSELQKISFSKFLSKEIGVNYSQISSLFSSSEGITIEKFIIKQKIEKVKELLTYDELTLSEIAYKLGYSSVQHLSNQFRQVTGLNPSYFKKLKENRRKPLDQID